MFLSLINSLNPLHEDFWLWKLFNLLNPFNEQFFGYTLWDLFFPNAKVDGMQLWSTICDTFDFLNIHSDNFFGKKIIDGILLGLETLFKFLFVPSEGYFSDRFGEIKDTLVSKMGYEAYIDIFGTLEDISDNGSSVVSLNGYQIGGMTFNIPKFVDFNNIVKYKDTWYGWVRGVMFVLLIIYNINQVYKLIRGTSLAEGRSYFGGNSNDSNGEMRK